MCEKSWTQLREELKMLPRQMCVTPVAEVLEYVDEILKLQDQLQSAQQEIERLREELNAYKPSAEVFYERLQRFVEERDKLIKLLDMIKDDADRFGEIVGIDVSETSLEEKGKVFNRKIETLQEERDKLIEGLREVVKFDYHTNPDIHYKRLAREILEEIGVTVEPDRLHDARAKIAKARFSPERLLKEHQWRPIETAPRDGTTILVYDDGDVYQARWNEKYKYWEYADHEQFGCGCCSAEIDGATHWMPIPAPPREVRG